MEPEYNRTTKSYLRQNCHHTNT